MDEDCDCGSLEFDREREHEENLFNRRVWSSCSNCDVILVALKTSSHWPGGGGGGGGGPLKPSIMMTAKSIDVLCSPLPALLSLRARSSVRVLGELVWGIPMYSQTEGRILGEFRRGTYPKGRGGLQGRS